MSASQGSFQLTTPVLLIGFNRIGPLRQVFEAIKQARPPRLYFAADGPRNAGEQAACDEVRALAKEVDWPCELHTRFNEKNMGLRKGVSSAIAWFFAHEEEGIVLEDDTLPVQSFFRFCQEMLEHYRTDQRVWVVMGNNLMIDGEYETDGDYYFSAHGYGAPWGWASWRRVWNHYDVDMGLWPSLKNSSRLRDFFLNDREAHDVHLMFDRVHAGHELVELPVGHHADRQPRAQHHSAHQPRGQYRFRGRRHEHHGPERSAEQTDRSGVRLPGSTSAVDRAGRGPRRGILQALHRLHIDGAPQDESESTPAQEGLERTYRMPTRTGTTRSARANW
ncbi:MAG: hypothetical protein IPI81_17125 [Flavobacteriales bacterium]|nr:hypothetical protein [Flavobacteriales bacterium]